MCQNWTLERSQVELVPVQGSEAHPTCQRRKPSDLFSLSTTLLPGTCVRGSWGAV